MYRCTGGSPESDTLFNLRANQFNSICASEAFAIEFYLDVELAK